MVPGAWACMAPLSPGLLAQPALDLVFVSMLLTATVTDLRRRIIPNRLLIACSAAALCLLGPVDPGSLPERAGAAAGCGAALLAVASARPGALGLGDVKLVAAIGLFLGFGVIPALLVALLAGSVWGAALVLRHGKVALRMTIPFGPCLALGGLTALLVGSRLPGLPIG
jgi:prepilin signal peptidase PulO-like enzyme (type II secretory pathway)